MFQEDKIIKQLFNLNYEKQKQIDTLNKKVEEVNVDVNNDINDNVECGFM